MSDRGILSSLRYLFADVIGEDDDTVLRTVTASNAVLAFFAQLQAAVYFVFLVRTLHLGAGLIGVLFLVAGGVYLTRGVYVELGRTGLGQAQTRVEWTIRPRMVPRTVNSGFFAPFAARTRSSNSRSRPRHQAWSHSTRSRSSSLSSSRNA